MHWQSRAMAGIISMLLACASTAEATNYYIRCGGKDSVGRAGNQDLDHIAWRTISFANSRVNHGDIVNVTSLNPADSSSLTLNIIAPINDGTEASPIRYIGNTTNPQNLPVPQISLLSGRSNIMVKGFRSKGGIAINSTSSVRAERNVIETCLVAGNVVIRGARYCRLSNNVMRLLSPANDGAVRIAAYNDTETPRSDTDTLRNNFIDLGPTGGAHRGFYLKGYTNNCVFDRNVVKATCDTSASSQTNQTGTCISVQESFANHYHDNRWEFEFGANNHLLASAKFEAISVRSGSHHNLWERDTILYGVNSDPCSDCFISLGCPVRTRCFHIETPPWSG